MTEIEIPLSKKKTLLMLAGAIMFVVFGVLFITKPETFISPFLQNITLVRLVGMLSVVFFGACFIYGLAALFGVAEPLHLVPRIMPYNGMAHVIGGLIFGGTLGLVGFCPGTCMVKAAGVPVTKLLLVARKKIAWLQIGRAREIR